MKKVAEVLRIILSSLSGLTDREVADEAGFETTQPANKALRDLAEPGLILRFKPEGEKTLMNYPLSILNPLDFGQAVKEQIEAIQSFTGESKEEIVRNAIGGGSIASDPERWKKIAVIEAERQDKSFDDYLNDLLTANASRGLQHDAWKFSLASNVNSSNRSPEKVVEEALGRYLMKRIKATNKLSS